MSRVDCSFKTQTSDILRNCHQDQGTSGQSRVGQNQSRVASPGWLRWDRISWSRLDLNQLVLSDQNSWSKWIRTS